MTASLRLALLAAAAVLASAQQMDDLRALRLKLSAGDLPSAESILEVHRAAKGEDGEYLMGLAWLARGAAMTTDWPAAAAHAQRAFDLAKAQLRTPADYTTRREAVYAMGTALEVKAQVLAAAHQQQQALRLLDNALAAHADAPFNFRARLWKRWNELALAGKAAPPIQPEETLSAPFPGLDNWHGKPVVLFLWAEWCGDCKAQAAALRRIVERYGPRGVHFAAVTRFYTPDHKAERQRVQEVWQKVYGAPAGVSVPISDAAMLRYGAAATPTFVLLDTRGAVRLYSPTRLTEERLAREIDRLLR